MWHDESTVLDILKAGRLIGEFTNGLTRRSFMRDEFAQAAVQHQLPVLGEAVKRLSPEFRSSHPRIPWKGVAGMRDRLIHGYDIVDLGEVWNAARRDVPSLVRALKGETKVKPRAR